MSGLGDPVTAAPPPPPAVERRIDRIVELASQGYTDKEISLKLGISKHTVDTHWQRLREKMGAKNRTAAVLAYLREKVEQQSRELRAVNEALQQAHAASREGMATLLATTQKQLAECQSSARDARHHQDYFERAAHMARAVVYELESLSPVAHRYVSASISALGHDHRALERAATTFYDLVHPEDLPLIYEKSLGATYLPGERYLFLYRMRTPEPRWVLDTHQAIHDDQGNLASVLGFVVDVHDLVQAGLLAPIVTRITIPSPPVSAPGPCPEPPLVAPARWSRKTGT
jgi:Response regulator containing a CheY-like receiver domain and an HTH DNA-binding domain